MTTAPHPAASLLPGFGDTVHGSQQAFRAILNALSRPGTTQTLPLPAAAPTGWSPTLTALALTLFDQDTPVWLDATATSPEVVTHLRFHCGCPIVSEPSAAAFAVICDSHTMPPIHAFSIGDPQYPDRSTSLILAIESHTGGPPMRWTGPGIKGSTSVSVQGLTADFVTQWADNHALYPSGVDVFLVAGDQVMGLPRGVSIEEI